MNNDFVVKDSGARQEFDTGAQRDTQEDKPRYDLISPFALERLAWVYARGAEKYGDRNWEKGIPYSRYLSSGERHLKQFEMGLVDEDHLAQAVWNLMAILHHQAVGPDGLDDLPRYTSLEDQKSTKAIPSRPEPDPGFKYVPQASVRERIKTFLRSVQR